MIGTTVNTRSRAALAIGLAALGVIAGCGPRIVVQDADGMALMDVQRGFCFVGCNIKARLPDGMRCGGYAVAMEYDRPLAANIYCPDAPTATLQVEAAKKTGTSVGILTPDADFFANEPIDIDAIVEKHVPSKET